MIGNADGATLRPLVEGWSRPEAQVHTDAWLGYNRLDRTRFQVEHKPSVGEYARDDDGDGVREVHCNTAEGIWTGQRNFLRIFRGVSKHFLSGYVAIFQWGYNLKRVTDAFLRALLWPPKAGTGGQT